MKDRKKTAPTPKLLNSELSAALGEPSRTVGVSIPDGCEYSTTGRYARGNKDADFIRMRFCCLKNQAGRVYGHVAENLSGITSAAATKS